MASDGKVTVGTELDNSGLTQGVAEAQKKLDGLAQKAKSVTSQVNATAGSVGATGDATSSKIQQILADSERSSKSKAAAIAAIYKKQGMTQSDAMKKAWSEIERTSGSSTKRVGKDIRDNVGKSADVVTDKLGGAKGISGALGGLVKVTAGIAASITAAFGAAAVAITKQSVSAYADYEQLAGGVETIFGESAAAVKAYAEDAFYTAGASANEYMEAVTGFSASLISSLGGDTAKAAQIANTAMVDMADNANKMGTAVESIRTAYQGFAKQNYTMLDNLKLGYGGTKTEMERLLADAQTITGIKYDISNLADVYTAIHVIQEKLGIAGATAAEAEKTISGSAAMTAAAWKNVLAAISGGGDLDKAINNLVFSISKYFENIVPVVERALAGVGRLIEQVAPMLVQTVATALIRAIPSLLNAVYQMIIGLAKGIYNGVIALFTGSVTEATVQLGKSASNSLGAVTEGYEDVAEATDEAKKAADRYLAGFDEIQKIGNSGTDTAADAVSDSASGAVSTPNIGMEEAATEGKTVVGVLDTIRSKLEEVASWTGLDRLWDGITSGIAKIDFGSIKTNFETVFRDLLPIAQSTFDGVGMVAGSFSGYVGTILGGIAAIAGKSIEIASGGVALFLQEQSGTISQWITDTATDLSTGFDNLSFSAETIFSSLWQALDENQLAVETSIANLLTSLSQMGMSIGTIVTDMFLGLTSGFSTWTQENQPLITAFFNSIIGLVTSLSNTVSSIVGNLFGTLMAWWNADGVTIWNGIVGCIGDIMTWVTRLWNELLAPVIQHVIDEVKRLWEEHLSPLWENILAFITSCWDFIQLLWDECLKPLVDRIINFFAAPIKNIINSIVDWVMDLVGMIVDVVSGIVRAFGGLLDFVTGIFSGDWEKAWEGICDFFGGIWDAVWGIIKGTINMIIDGLNMLWSGLYAVLRNIVNGVGGIVGAAGKLLGQDWGWEIPADPPMIPRLAKGAVLPANKPFLAMVGDQKHGTNVEAPLATIQEAVALCMQDVIASNIAGQEAVVAVLRDILEAVLGIHVGDDVIGQAVARYNAKMAVIRGGG